MQSKQLFCNGEVIKNNERAKGNFFNMDTKNYYCEIVRHRKDCV